MDVFTACPAQGNPVQAPLNRWGARLKPIFRFGEQIIFTADSVIMPRSFFKHP
jgi:hypothetical protein